MLSVYMTGVPVAHVDERPFRTIHHVECPVLQLQSKRCSSCADYRTNLIAIAKKEAATEHKRMSINTNHRYMSKPKMIKEITCLRAVLKEHKQRISQLEKMIECDHRSTALDETIHKDMLTIMQENHQHIINSYPEDSFQHIFWMNQYQAAQQKTRSRFRWNPAMIRWCIYLHHKSSKAYDLLRKSNCIYLPSQRTLREYTHAINASSGFSNELDAQLMNDAKLSTLQDHQKYVGLLGDEMYIKEGLVYDNSTGDLIGYCDLGDINNHLLHLEQEYIHVGSDDKINNTLASTMMVLMVRGLFINFTFPYASFPTSNLTGELMVPMFYEAIMRLERCGFKVTCITMDGNSVNRKFIKLVSTNPGPIKYKFKNPLSHDNREIYFFSDPPHLLKTARNCLANPKRNMEVLPNKEITITYNYYIFFFSLRESASAGNTYCNCMKWQPKQQV